MHEQEKLKVMLRDNPCEVIVQRQLVLKVSARVVFTRQSESA